jgi:hypothetical protein
MNAFAAYLLSPLPVRRGRAREGAARSTLILPNPHPSPPPEYREREKSGQRDRIWRCTTRSTGFQPVVLNSQPGRLCYEAANAIGVEKRGRRCS